MDNNVHAGHRKRVKRRYLNDGLDSFTDHQILELILFYSIPMKDTNEIAHRMINAFGSLAALFEANPKDISLKCGVSENTAILISLVPSLSRKYMTGKQGERIILNSTKKAGEYLVSLFIGRRYENFFVLCLDSQNKLNHAALVHEGTLNEVAVYPRLIVELVLRYQANSVILAHNHPGGSLKPSNDDIEVTKTIVSALDPISIKVLDHIIVAGNEYISLKQQSLF
ncbi:MAG: JAB domain-containing protein [Ignavibacteriales bacterium]